MTDKQIAVKVDHVSKYFATTEATTTVFELLWSIASKESKGYKEQHVLKDISLK